MNLVIRAVMLDEQPLEEPLLGIFDARGGTIGRSEANTLALPDPERRLSRLQAEVSSGTEGYVIRNAGSTTSILLNERTLAPGDVGRLAHRDELRLGGYVLRVLLEAPAGVTGGGSRGHVAVDARGGVDGRGGASDGGNGVDGRTDPRYMAPRPGTGRDAVDANNPFADLVSPAASPSAGPSGDPHADPFAFLGAGDPRPAAGVSSDPFAFLDAGSPAPSPARGPSAAATPAPRAVLPDDFDPFADLAGPGTAARPPAPAARVPNAGSGDDLLASVGAGAGRSPGLDEAFGLAGTGSTDALAAFLSGGTTPSPRARGGDGMVLPSTDPLAMFAAPAAPVSAAPSRPAAAFNHTAELQAAYRPPRIVEPVPAATAASPMPTPGGATPPQRLPAAPPVAPSRSPAPAAASAPAPTPAPTPAPIPAPIPAPAPFAAAAPIASPAAPPSALWSAFCAGAGVALPMPQGLTPEHMHLLGQLLREAIDGTRQLLAQRDAERRAVRVGPAPAGARDHNPLLFAADTQVALERLLLPPVRGFMPAPAAMRGAMSELAGHGVATAHGSQAGLGAALAQFEPQQLDALLADKALLAMNRKAKVWEQYQQRYDAVRKLALERYRAQLAEALGEAGVPPPRS